MHRYRSKIRSLKVHEMWGGHLYVRLSPGRYRVNQKRILLSRQEMNRSRPSYPLRNRGCEKGMRIRFPRNPRFKISIFFPWRRTKLYKRVL